MVGIKLAPLVALSFVLMLHCYAATGYKINGDYIEMPSSDELQDKYHERIFKALKELEIDDSMNYDVIRGKLGYLAVSARTEYKDIYETLLKLGPGWFPSDTTKIVKSILARHVPNARLKFGVNIRILLSNFVKPLIGERSSSMWDWMKIDYFGKVWIQFDEMFKAAFDLTSDDELESKLKGFDFAHGQLNSRKMLEVVKQIEYDETISESRRKHTTYTNNMEEHLANKASLATAGMTFKFLGEDSLKPLEWFMKRKCTKDLSDAMDIYNLSAILDGQEQLADPILNRLNEYNRFCLAWSKRDVRKQIKANIVKCYKSDSR